VVVLGGRSDPVLGPAGWAEKTVVDGKAVRVEGSKWLLDSQSGDGHGGSLGTGTAVTCIRSIITFGIVQFRGDMSGGG
jgi:hypothetical protein